MRRALRPGRDPRVAQLDVDRGRHLVPGRAAQGHGRVPRRRHPRACSWTPGTASPRHDGGAITAPESLAGAEAELTATYGKDVVASIQRTIDRVRRSEPSGPTEPYFCHTVCEIGAEPMAPVMDRLNTWMDEHPREVLVLFIQDTVTPADTAAVLEKAGLADKAYVHPDGAEWPTLGEMIDSNKRLVVLMENKGGGDTVPVPAPGLRPRPGHRVHVQDRRGLRLLAQARPARQPAVLGQPLAGQLHRR